MKINDSDGSKMLNCLISTCMSIMNFSSLEKGENDKLQPCMPCQLNLDYGANEKL